MCYSFNVSIISYVLAMIAGLYALYNRLPILGVLIICYAQMQLSEAIIWFGIDTNNDHLNRLGTTVGKWALPLHNVALGIGVLISYNTQEQTLYKWLPLIAGLAFYFAVWHCHYRGTHHSRETNVTGTSEFAQLAWPYPHTWYALSLLLSGVIVLGYVRPLYPLGLLSWVAFIGTAIVTYFKAQNETFGSMWCWSTAILAPVFVGFAVSMVDGSSHG